MGSPNSRANATTTGGERASPTDSAENTAPAVIKSKSRPAQTRDPLDWAIPAQRFRGALAWQTSDLPKYQRWVRFLASLLGVDLRSDEGIARLAACARLSERAVRSALHRSRAALIPSAGGYAPAAADVAGYVALVTSDRALPASVLATLAVLVRHLGRGTSSTFVSIGTMAALSGWSARSVDRALARLRDDGFITREDWERRPSGNVRVRTIQWSAGKPLLGGGTAAHAANGVGGGVPMAHEPLLSFADQKNLPPNLSPADAAWPPRVLGGGGGDSPIQFSVQRLASERGLDPEAQRRLSSLVLAKLTSQWGESGTYTLEEIEQTIRELPSLTSKFPEPRAGESVTAGEASSPANRPEPAETQPEEPPGPMTSMIQRWSELGYGSVSLERVSFWLAPKKEGRRFSLQELEHAVVGAREQTGRVDRSVGAILSSQRSIESGLRHYEAKFAAEHAKQRELDAELVAEQARREAQPPEKPSPQQIAEARRRLGFASLPPPNTPTGRPGGTHISGPNIFALGAILGNISNNGLAGVSEFAGKREMRRSILDPGRKNDTGSSWARPPQPSPVRPVSPAFRSPPVDPAKRSPQPPPGPAQSVSRPLPSPFARGRPAFGRLGPASPQHSTPPPLSTPAAIPTLGIARPAFTRSVAAASPSPRRPRPRRPAPAELLPRPKPLRYRLAARRAAPVVIAGLRFSLTLRAALVCAPIRLQHLFAKPPSRSVDRPRELRRYCSAQALAKPPMLWTIVGAPRGPP